MGIMSNQKHWIINLLFIISDVLIVNAMFRLAFLIRNSLIVAPKASLANAFPIIQMGIFFCVGVFFIQGLYPGYGLTAVKELEKMESAIALAFFLLATVSYLNKPYQDFSRLVLLEAWIMNSISLPILRFLLRNLLSRFPWYGVQVIIFGAGIWAEQVESSIRRIRRLGWRVQAVYPTSAVGTMDVNKSNFRVAVLAASEGDDFEAAARILSQQFRRVILIWQKNNSGSLWVEPRDLDGQLGLEFHYHLLVRRNRWLKQVIDWVGGSLLLLTLSPMLALISLLVALDSKGPIFYRQERLGQTGKPFLVWKFRTMVMGAETQLEHILTADPCAREEYQTFHKLINDPRITKIGSLLRRFSLDEFPQIINVILGEMSLVGPRAYMVSELADIGTYAPIILRVKPGMTGWWQVLGRHTTSFDDRLRMDEYYISNWSIWMDIYILLKTVGVVLQGRGI